MIGCRMERFAVTASSFVGLSLKFTEGALVFKSQVGLFEPFSIV